MIIVSQDKKITVENLNLGIRNTGEYNQNYVIYNTQIGEDLGEYKTEERAKEVLQGIIAVYQVSKMFTCTGSEVQEIIADKYKEKGIEPFKFEMPKE